MDDGQQGATDSVAPAPAAPAPVFLGQTFGGAQNQVFQPTPQPNQPGASSTSYVKGAPLWEESKPLQPSFQWGQFFIGLAAPFVVVFLLGVIIDSLTSSHYDDLHGYEEALVSPDENGHYSTQISVRPGHEVDYCSIYPDEYTDEWSNEQIFCEVNWDDSLEVRQYLEPTTQIQPMAFAIDEENGTISVSYNGTLSNADDISGRLITSNGNLYHRIYSADHETDNTSSTSYLNSTFTPTNQTLYIYFDAVFFSSNEILEVHSCEGGYTYYGCNTSQMETGYGMSVSWFGEQEHVQIGELTASNETLWFIPNADELTPYTVEIQTYDYELDQSTQLTEEIAEGAVCLLPLAYIGAIIMSFVKGKKALGWGLLSSPLLSILLFVGFILFILLSYSGGF